MLYHEVVSDSLDTLASLAGDARDTTDEATQAAIYAKATRFTSLLTAIDQCYTENGYIAEKIGTTKTWMASLCQRDAGNDLPQDQIWQTVTDALTALRGQHGFNIP